MINKSSTADLDKLSPVQVDHYWMTLALNQAKKAEELAEVPVGAVLVKDDRLIAQAHNQPISANDPTAHA